MLSATIKSKAVLYCRVSSKEQEETGYSLPAQEKFLREYAEKNNFNVEKVFSISESASGRMQRKIFSQMMGYVRQHRINVIIVETTDRLTRNFADVPIIDAWVLEDENHQIHLAKESCILNKNSRSHEWFMWRVKVATAEYYVRLLSENVKKGQKEKLAQGQLPQKPPLGYKTIGEKGKKVHVIDEETAPLIRKIFEWYATGNYSLARLESELYKAGLRSKSGGRIGISWIHRLLSDPFYYGKIRWNGQTYQGHHEPLISKDYFDKVRELLRRKIQNPHFKKHNPIFKSKMHCEHCGGLVTWYTKKGHWYGHCNNHGQFRNCPAKTCIRQEKVEEQIIGCLDILAPKNEEVLGWIENIIREEHSQNIAERENEVQRLTSLLEQVRRRKDKIYEDKIDGKIPLDFYERKFAEYSKEEEDLEDALIRLNDKTDEYQQLGVAIHELAYKAHEIYEKATDDEKRLLLSQIFTNLVQNRYEIKPNYTLAAQYLAEWIPRLNADYEPQKSLSIKSETGAFAPDKTAWLAWRDSLRTVKWEKLFPYPDVSLRQINYLLRIPLQNQSPASGRMAA